MNDELSRCYELLGVAPGTAGRELKQAYLDMAKVWHPDRFSHDPRLQRKAQEKLKEINEAYGLLTSGRAARSSARRAPAPAETYAPPAERPRRPRLLIIVAFVFCAAFAAAVFFLAPSDLMRRGAEATTEERPAPRAVKEAAQPEGEAKPSAGQPARADERAARRPSVETSDGGEAAAQPPRAMPTVTVRIDAQTGLLATKDCPVVSRMTYPAGSEPKQFCAADHRPKESRLKSVAKRVVTPGKWFGDEAPPPGAEKPKEK